MGQCQHCARAPLAASDHEGAVPPEACPARRVSDPLDSGHSSGDETCVPTAAGACGAAGGGEAEDGAGRGSHSSESSGKYSLRGSEASLGEDRLALHAREDACLLDMPVFEDEEDEAAEDGGAAGEGAGPPHGDPGSRKASRGSAGSERGSFSSVASVAVTTILKARLGRSSSLTVPEDDPCSCPAPCTARGARTVSLRLPRSYGGDGDTNLPTIYVDDSPRQRCRGRRSSLRRALSLLSLSTVLRGDAAPASPAPREALPPKPQKPVQKILRQPRRRHNTVRGMSGLAIDGASGVQGGGAACPALQRAHTLYYPTAATMRHATTARRARSVAT